MSKDDFDDLLDDNIDDLEPVICKKKEDAEVVHEEDVNDDADENSEKNSVESSTIFINDSESVEDEHELNEEESESTEEAELVEAGPELVDEVVEDLAEESQNLNSDEQFVLDEESESIQESQTDQESGQDVENKTYAKIAAEDEVAAAEEVPEESSADAEQINTDEIGLTEENITENVIAEVAEKVKESHKKTPRSHDGEILKTPEGGDIILKNIGAVMHDSMIPYSEFVIMDRALPRVEDGLKPVQRRILFAMKELGLEPDKPFRKSAGIVGECLGKYHPHGDSSVYDAMVRLAQPFNMNMPLVIGQGNFGSEDGDPAAAMRYTEAKLSHLAMELLRGIDKETVPFSLTFDDRNTEPDILPGRYPNLLVNGATGIAVGLATNIPPHNLAEVIDAHIAFIDDPSITLRQVMKIIKGPDFPTGGFVICGEELTNAYKKGKGKVIMRAKIHIEVEGNDRRNIVITELPYQVNKVQLQKNIADLRETKKGILSGISEIRDESDRRGMRIVIKVKREFDAKAICELLFKFTNLQCNYNINMVAIADGKPKLMGLLALIEYYVNFQREVIYKRCVFDLENAKERAHILEGLLIAIRNIDEVVRIIKTSKHTLEAKERLRSTFKLSERQAQAILDLRLARLTSLEVFKLEQELEELKILIAKLTKIIGSKKLQFEIVKQELTEIKRKHKIERRSRIINSLEDAVITADDDERPVEEVVITITPEAHIKRMPAKHFSMSRTEFAPGLGVNDVNLVVIATQTDKMLYIFTNFGNCYKLDAGDVPECKLRDRGAKFKDIFKDSIDGERPVAIYAVPQETIPEGELVWLTKLGMIKRSTWAEACGVIKTIFQCVKLREDDEVMRVDEFKQGRTIVLMSSGGMILHALTNDVPLQGRIAGGVKGISMAENDYCVCNCIGKQTGYIIALSNKGSVKKVDIKTIEKMVRYRKGFKFGSLEGSEKIVYALWVKGDEDLAVIDQNNKVYFVPLEKIPVTDRTNKFKSFPNLPKSSRIQNAWVHRRKKNN